MCVKYTGAVKTDKYKENGMNYLAEYGLFYVIFGILSLKKSSWQFAKNTLAGRLTTQGRKRTLIIVFM